MPPTEPAADCNADRAGPASSAPPGMERFIQYETPRFPRGRSALSRQPAADISPYELFLLLTTTSEDKMPERTLL